MDEQTAQMREMIRDTFNIVAEAYGTGSSRFFHLAGQTMADLHQLGGAEHILDLASGTGAAAIPLARRVPRGRVTGVDLSSGMLAQARARAQQEGLSNIEFHEQDMTELDLPEAGFDHANCAFGLFFVDDMVSLLAHIASKVRPGGSVMISGFCGDSFMPAADITLGLLPDYGVEPPETIGWKRMAEPEQLQALFDGAGLVDMNIERRSLGYYVDREGWWEVVWNAGFRGLVAQLGDRLPEYRRELDSRLAAIETDQGIWLEVDVNFTRGIRP